MRPKTYKPREKITKRDPIQTTIADLVLKYREITGVPRVELGRRLEVSWQILSNLEKENGTVHESQYQKIVDKIRIEIKSVVDELECLEYGIIEKYFDLRKQIKELS
jgi:ribosome-binding protein aMBF1 (putative translation factor)